MRQDWPARPAPGRYRRLRPPAREPHRARRQRAKISLGNQFISNPCIVFALCRHLQGLFWVFSLRRKFFCSSLQLCCRGNSPCCCFAWRVLSWKWSAFPAALGLADPPACAGQDPRRAPPARPAPQTPLGSAAAPLCPCPRRAEAPQTHRARRRRPEEGSGGAAGCRWARPLGS